jgi:hypothetical protein
MTENGMSSTASLRKFRVRCSTEDAYVYVWSDTEPETCPNSADHEIEADKTVELERVSASQSEVTNLPLTPFNRLQVAEDTVLLSLRPGHGVSKLRDIVNTENGGSVTNELGEPAFLFKTIGVDSLASMRSAQRTRFLAGSCGQVSIGGHLATRPVDDQCARFGVFDEGNGYYFEIDAANLYVVVLNDGLVTKVPRNSFNLDTLDGNGPSGHVINPMKGYIWTITFTMFGYGAVEFSITAENARQDQCAIAMHRYYSQSRPAVAIPNLPINVTLRNGARGGECKAYVTARKYSVQGKFEPMQREGSSYMLRSVSGEGWVPVLSMRRKSSHVHTPVRLNVADVFCELNKTVFKVKTGPVLSEDAVWKTPECYSDTETAVEVCTGPGTSASGGTCIWKNFVKSANDTLQSSNINFYLIESDTVTLFVRDPDQFGVIGACLKWSEEW